MPPEVNAQAMDELPTLLRTWLDEFRGITGEDGRITIRTGTLGDRVWLEFGDNGSGIPPELQQKIFDPFFTTKPVGKGTGLGLSLSYGIIQKHHGVLSVHSEVGKGTVFRIELPTLQPKESQEKEDADVRNG